MQNYNATSNRIKIGKSGFGPRMAKMLWRSIPITVKRFFTDVDGQIVDKAVVPVSLQVKYPVFMFGVFDMESGYKAGSNVCPQVNGIDYLMSFVNGMGASSQSVIGFTGLNEIQGQLAVGDIVHVFTDDKQNPNYFIWIVQSTNSLAGLASIMKNLQTSQQDNRLGKLFIYEMLLITANQQQWRQPFNFTVYDNLGNYTNDPIGPMMFRGPYTELENLIRLDIEIMIDQYIGVNLYMDFTEDLLSVDFNIMKIE